MDQVLGLRDNVGSEILMVLLTRRTNTVECYIVVLKLCEGAFSGTSS